MNITTSTRPIWTIEQKMTISMPHIIDSAGISDHCLKTATVSIQHRSLTKVHSTIRRNLSDFDSVKFESIVRSSALFTVLSMDVDGFTDQLIDHIIFALDAVCLLTSRRRRLSNRHHQPLSRAFVLPILKKPTANYHPIWTSKKFLR